VDSLLGDRQLRVLATSDSNLIEVLTTLSIQNMEQRIFPYHCNELPPFSFDVSAEQRAHLRQVPVMRVVGHCLVMPHQLARPSIEDDQ
jgi:hypothetical protein